MHLIPTQEEVVAVLRETGALRDGHFEYPTGLHSNEYLQVPLAMRYSQYQRMLSVGLSRLLRANPEIRAIVPRSFDRHAGDRRPAGGLRRVRGAARQTGLLGRARARCRAARVSASTWSPQPGEQVVMVDDILRTGNKLTELKTLLESRGATVVGLAVIIYQPTPQTLGFGSLPLYYLAKLEASYYAAGAECALCKRGLPLEKVWI